MGHQHLGELPASKRWREVIALIAAGAGATEIAAATAEAAEKQLGSASGDQGLRNAVWMLAQIPLAARHTDFTTRLNELGLAVGDQPGLADIGAAMMIALDRKLAHAKNRTDLGELAQLCAVASLQAVAGRELPELFGRSGTETKRALRGLANAGQFAVLAKDFFARLMFSTLSYFLDRELGKHVGAHSRFATMSEQNAFRQALELHCRESAEILKEYAGTWFSKGAYEGTLNETSTDRFARRAFEKLNEELAARRTEYA